MAKAKFDEFDFVELVLSDDAARIFAIATGLEAETCAIGCIFDGELIGREEFVAVEGCEG